MNRLNFKPLAISETVAQIFFEGCIAKKDNSSWFEEWCTYFKTCQFRTFLPLTLSWSRSISCCMHSFTLQESVFSTSSGASGFSYSESIPVKPDEINGIKCTVRALSSIQKMTWKAYFSSISIFVWIWNDLRNRYPVTMPKTSEPVTIFSSLVITFNQ